MNQEIDQNQTTGTDQTSDTSNTPIAQVVTVSGMIELLLQCNLNAVDIDNKIGAGIGFSVKSLQDNTIYSNESATPEIKRLRALYLREQMKCVYRTTPFIGSVKVAAKLGISESESRFIYDTLLSSGEVSFKLSMPSWQTPGNRKLLREHLVK